MYQALRVVHGADDAWACQPSCVWISLVLKVLLFASAAFTNKVRYKAADPQAFDGFSSLCSRAHMLSEHGLAWRVTSKER